MNRELLDRTADENSTKDDGLHVSPRLHKTQCKAQGGVNEEELQEKRRQLAEIIKLKYCEARRMKFPSSNLLMIILDNVKKFKKIDDDYWKEMYPNMVNEIEDYFSLLDQIYGK